MQGCGGRLGRIRTRCQMQLRRLVQGRVSGHGDRWEGGQQELQAHHVLRRRDVRRHRGPARLRQELGGQHAVHLAGREGGGRRHLQAEGLAGSARRARRLQLRSADARGVGPHAQVPPQVHARPPPCAERRGQPGLRPLPRRAEAPVVRGRGRGGRLPLLGVVPAGDGAIWRRPRGPSGVQRGPADLRAAAPVPAPQGGLVPPAPAPRPRRGGLRRLPAGRPGLRPLPRRLRPGLRGDRRRGGPGEDLQEGEHGGKPAPRQVQRHLGSAVVPGQRGARRGRGASAVLLPRGDLQSRRWRAEDPGPLCEEGLFTDPVGPAAG
mmetsp:Transcript_27167/g.78004  ORF Transcript_27167/g.78004 Transcript_27167/m.78004 type:complete len:321 (-) Transcript_27167:2470-3432(-)